MTRPLHGFRVVVTAVVASWATSPAHSADDPLDTVVVTGSREAVRREVQAFVANATRMDGELIGRWRSYVCPLVAGVSGPQADFVRQRIIEVFDTVRKRQRKAGKACTPNLFVIISEEADHVIADWKQRDPGMFRWKSREGVTHSKGPGAVRTWHNATEEPSQGDPLVNAQIGPAEAPVGRDLGSRIVSSAAEAITAVVVLVDTQATGKVTLAQLTDYIAMVSLAQLDLSADLGGINSILRLFAQPRPDVPPVALTDWDYAFLRALYRTSYEPANQRRDIRARMVRELAPP